MYGGGGGGVVDEYIVGTVMRQMRRKLLRLGVMHAIWGSMRKCKIVHIYILERILTDN